MKEQVKVGWLLVLTLSVSQAVAMTRVGDSAPDFSLQDSQGKSVNLSDYKNKTVVLEWLNYRCPFVKKHYQSGNIPGLQLKYTDKGIVWLSIVSSAPGKQGFYSPKALAQKNSSMKNHATYVLRDPSGTVGRLYGAKTTPQFVIIDKQGMVVYTGAIDSVPRTETSGIKQAEHYVGSALDALLVNRAIKTPVSQPYGCGVRY